MYNLYNMLKLVAFSIINISNFSILEEDVIIKLKLA